MEKFFGTRPHIRHFRVFGVWAFARIPVQRGDHSARSQQGIFIGYSDSAMGGYRVYLPSTNEIIVSNHIRFGISPTRHTTIEELAEPVVEEIVDRLHLENVNTRHVQDLIIRERRRRENMAPTITNTEETRADIDEGLPDQIRDLTIE